MIEKCKHKLNALYALKSRPMILRNEKTIIRYDEFQIKAIQTKEHNATMNVALLRK